MGYFNIDPNMTQISGTCVMEESVITISFNGGTIRFTFLKVIGPFLFFTERQTGEGRIWDSWVLFLANALTSCMPGAKSFQLIVPQFPDT